MIPSQHSTFDLVLAYWKSLCSPNAIPSSEDFDLIRVPEALPDITYWEMMPDDDVICRMAGTQVIARMQHDITGARLSCVMPEAMRPTVLRDLKTILTHPCALWFQHQNRHATGKVVRIEALMLPLAGGRKAHPKFIAVNHMLETLRYDADVSNTAVELGQTTDGHAFIDVGWGVPEEETGN
ncbi:MAG: PAS domain-containing protein [Parvibaculaceae bacterium]